MESGELEGELDPVTYTDRVPVPVPELSFRSHDPAALYSCQLTHLEVVVITLLADGYTFREIASRRRIRQYRVRDLVRSICRKLDMPSRYRLLCAWECELFHVGLLALGFVPYPTKPRG